MILDGSSFFSLEDVPGPVRELFPDGTWAWEALHHVGPLAESLCAGTTIVRGEVMSGAHLAGPVVVEDGAVVEPTAYVEGPAYIGEGCRVRHGAYVRGSVVMLPGSVVGHATEVKNSLFFPAAAAPHFAYVGDSLLGTNVNLGAGTKLSNLPITSHRDPSTGLRPTVTVDIRGAREDTGLEKIGAILGDGVQVGCNAVLSPGCLVGPRAQIYANLSLGKGFHEGDRIYKLRQSVEAAVLEPRGA